MAKMKVHELAKEIGKQSKDVIAFLQDKGIEVKAAQSSLEEDAVSMVRKEFGAAPVKSAGTVPNQNTGKAEEKSVQMEKEDKIEKKIPEARAEEKTEQPKKKKKDFSVVILDWKMPGKDGVDTTKEIRSVVGDEVPIIILSAYDWSDIEAEALEAGVDAFIEKPLFKSRLTRVLKEVLGLGSEEKEITALEAFQQEDFSGKRVLLVEDNELNIEVATELLDVVGIQVEQALNGELAVQCMMEREPGYFDLIFMDIQMPVMNGYEAAKAIRASDRADLKEIPIVAMTADAFADDIRKAEEAGMNGHISKPVDIGKLEDALKKWIQ